MSQQVDLPERLYCYKGILNDGSRWDHFTARPDDVFVCTLGKNGTTWMQAICALLIFQKPELDFNPGVRSPWLDVTFVPIEEIIADLEAQTERRVIKTHTPLDGIPFFPECTYITVYRDPPRPPTFCQVAGLDLSHVDPGSPWSESFVRQLLACYSK